MKTRSSLASLFLLSSFFFISCGRFKDPDFNGIENIRVNRISKNETTLSLDMVYFNPNNARLQLKKAEGDAWLDGNLLGHFSIDSAVSIPAKDTFYLPVNLSLDMKNTLKNSALLLLKNEVLLKIDGKARVGKAGIFINYPLRYEEKYRPDELFHLNTDKIKAKEPG